MNTFDTLFEPIPLAPFLGDCVGLRLRALPSGWRMVHPEGAIPLHERDDCLGVLVSHIGPAYVFAIARKGNPPTREEIAQARELFAIPATIHISCKLLPGAHYLFRFDHDLALPAVDEEASRQRLEKLFAELDRLHADFKATTIDPKPIPRGWTRQVSDAGILFMREDGLAAQVSVHRENGQTEALISVSAPKHAPSHAVIVSTARMFLPGNVIKSVQVEAAKKMAGRRFFVLARCTLGDAAQA